MRAIKLVYTNESLGHSFGDEIIALDDSSTFGDDDVSMGDIYREAIRQGYGRCTSKVWQDICTGGTKHIGWFFVSRQRYEDTGGIYLRGVWVIVGEHRPAVREDVV